MAKNDFMDGGCACGRVRYRMQGPPITVNACHCHDCQRSTGSAFAVNAMIESDHLAMIGDADAERLLLPGGQHLWRCAACGTGLFGDHRMMHDHIRFVFAGTLDRAACLPPSAHYFVSRKHPWIALPDDVPAFDTVPTDGSGGPPMTAEAQQRMAAAFKG